MPKESLKESLPVKLDPFRFADNAIRVHGVLPVKQLARLSSSLFTDDGEVDVNLTFGVDEEGIRFVRGHYEAHLTLQCQRCMESLIYGITDDFALAIVNPPKVGKEADQLPSRYDPALITDGMLHVPDMVEDELIVNLPIVPMHDSTDCRVKLPLVADSGLSPELEKDNPFKVIELLRSKRDQK
jgi:uncharacterized protein